MKKAILIFILFLLTSHLDASGKNDSLRRYKSDRFAIGMNINNFGRDVGLGINVTSPYFFNGSLAFRISENYQWLSHKDNSGNNIWSGYQIIRVGVIGGNFILNKALRLYGEGGLAILIANTDLSAINATVGGYGIFGFEFYLNNGFSYFIELGGIGTGATADKVPGKPIYANGFLSSVGFRVNL